MVRLKLDQFAIPNQDIYMFQFHNGSIKTKNMCYFFGVEPKFQFHNGSIKTKKMCDFFQVKHSFQFHNGSIKT